MNKLFRRLSVGTATVAAGSIGVTVPAFAATASGTTTPTGADLSALKAKAAAAISVRQSALTKAVTDVGSNQYLTAADRTTILSVLTTDEGDLTALGAQIQADSTYAQAEADYRTIFTTYRVFALRLPQARFAESADDLTGTVLPHLTDAHSRLLALLAGPDSAKDTPAVQALMSDLAAQINTVSSDTSGLSATVLAITPSQYDADTTILEGPKAQLRTSEAAAHQADTDINSIVEDLQ